MARGLVRMDRESGFCIWERRRDMAAVSSQSCRQGSQAEQLSTALQHSQPQRWAPLPAPPAPGSAHSQSFHLPHEVGESD